MLLTVTDDHNLPGVLSQSRALMLTSKVSSSDGYGAYLASEEYLEGVDVGLSNLYSLPDYMSYISPGDVIKLSPDGRIRCLFRPSAKYNTVLLTEQCDQYCLMCSQPPKDVNDSWLLDQALELLEVIPKSTRNMGFSGGEPTLYGDGLLELIAKCKSYLPSTGIDILTNGRAFADPIFAEKVADVRHPNCMFCIPLYSDDPVTHEYVVQRQGAFDETIKGILNLKALQQKVEIRIVIHQQTVPRLVETCEFIARNLVFVDHVALMGLEITGFTRANLDTLWIDPYDYKDTLSDAVSLLNAYGVSNSVYNHQLCTINEDILENYVHSISDWKNEFVKECQNCKRRSECGGFFSSSKQHRYSDYIKPFENV